VPDDLSNKDVKCPNCRNVFLAPITDLAPSGVEPPVASSSAGQNEGFKPQESGPLTSDSKSSESESPAPPGALGRPELEVCPFCGESIPREAFRCQHCGEVIEDEEDDRPWDRPGSAFRRDLEPHRGGLILTLGIVSIVIGLPFSACCQGFGLVFAVAGIALGITAWVLGQRDLKKIDTQAMDPRGRATVQAGRICGIVGTSLSIVGAIIGIAIVVVYSIFLFGAMRGGPGGPPPPPPPANPAPVPKMRVQANHLELAGVELPGVFPRSNLGARNSWRA